jgi:hypothetical protein
MTGPDHYRAAEAALEFVHDNPPSRREMPGARLTLQFAQVHATLALTAAVVDGPAVMRPEDRDDWDRATGRLR